MYFPVSVSVNLTLYHSYDYPTFCFLFPAFMLEEVLIMEQGTGDSLSGIGGVGLDRGRWTRGHVTRTWDIIIDM